MSDTRAPHDLETTARSIIDSNRFMTIATADRDGLPWASPVWYAPDRYRQFLWASSPEATHSRNIAVRPQVAIVIFDSHRTGGWNAVYLSAAAEQLDDVEEGLGIYSARSEEQGFGPWTPDRVTPPARHRLYRATATEHFLLDPQDQRLPVDLTER